MSSYDIFLEMYLIYKLISLPRAHERHKTITERIKNPLNCVFLKSRAMKTKLILSNNDISGLTEILETDRKTLIEDLKHIFKGLNIFVYENFLISKLNSSCLLQETEYKIRANRIKVTKYIEFNEIKPSNQSWISDFSFITEFLDTKLFNILSYMLILSPFEILSLKIYHVVSSCEDITLNNEPEQLIFFNSILEICYKCNNKIENYMEASFIHQFDTVLLQVFNFFKEAIQAYYNNFILNSGIINKFLTQLLYYYKEFLIYLSLIEYKVGNCWLNLIVDISKPIFENFIDNKIKLYISDHNVLISRVFTNFDNCSNSLKKIDSWKLSFVFEITLSKYIVKNISLIKTIYINRTSQKENIYINIADFIPFKVLALKFIKKDDNYKNKFLKKFDKDFITVYIAYIEQLSEKVKQELDNLEQKKETNCDQISAVEKCSIELIDVLKMGLSFLKEIYALSNCTLIGEETNKQNCFGEQNHVVFLYNKLVTYYIKNVVSNLIVYLNHLNNRMVELIDNPNTNEIKVLEQNFLIFNSIVMCLKFSNELEKMFFLNKNPKEKQKIVLPINKRCFYQVDAMVTVNSNQNNISVFLNKQRLFNGKNRLHIQTLMSSNTLLVTCKNINNTNSTTCNLLLVQKNDRISINFKNKTFPKIELRINDIVTESCKLSFYIKIYKVFTTTMINNSLDHYVRCFFLNSNWNHIIRDFKKYELQEFMSDLLKVYFFNNLWLYICFKLYHKVVNLTKVESTCEANDAAHFKKSFDKVKQELEDSFFSLANYTFLDQTSKINKYYKLILKHAANNKDLKANDIILQNNQKTNFLISTYTEKKDSLLDKIHSNNSLENINIFSNKCSNCTIKINKNKENSCQSYEDYANRSLKTTNYGKFDIHRAYVEKDLRDFSFDDYL